MRHRRVYTEKPVQNTLYYKACTKHFPVLLCTTKLAQSTSQYYFVLQSLHTARPSITLYYKTYRKHFPVLLCTTKLAASTTLYYKACTKHFPVLLCTAKLAQSTSQYNFVLQSLHKSTAQYYFVLQSLHKAGSNTTLYYKVCTKHFPGLLCITKLAQVRRSTTLYCKPCTQYVPVLLCTTMLAQRKLLHTTISFAEELLHTANFLSREGFTHRNFYTQQTFSQRNFYTQHTFTHSKRLHTNTEAFTQRHRNFYTQQVFAHKIFYTQQTFTENILHRKTFLYIITTEIAAPKLDLGAKAKTGGTLHRRLQPLYAEKRAVSCSGFLHKTSPMQNSCSHYNAFCGITMQFASTRCRTQRRNRLTSKRSN